MSMLGLFLVVGIVACVVSAVRGGKTHKVIVGFEPEPEQRGEGLGGQKGRAELRGGVLPA